MPRRYGSDVDIIPAKGGMGPGGIGAGNIPATRTLTKAELDTAMKEFQGKGGNVQKIAPNQPDTSRAAKDIEVAKNTNPDMMSSGAQRAQPHGTLEWIEKNMKKGGKVKSASARADGIAIRGKTRA